MFTLNCKGRLLVIDQPVVMGIINVTPDSFYPGSRQNNISQVLQKAEQMIKEGTAILDIGGQSTRPGAAGLNEEEELGRVVPVIESLHFNFPEVVISVDTYRAKIAEVSVQAGASIVNDISGGDFDEAMLTVVAALKVPFVCMHVKGTPQTMHVDPSYENLIREILDHFIAKVDRLKRAGIHDVIVDPGFGFSKSVEHNFRLLKEMSVLSMLGKPILVGLSRKSTVYRTLGLTAEEALNGTTVLNTIALLHGANILRVHDVKEAMEAIRLVDKYRKSPL
jgi:dihydropteroate synthase